MKNYNTLLIALLVIVGCSNAPKENTSKLTLGLAQSTVTKGANQTEIMKVLGAPNIISKDKLGNETWTYDRISRDAQSNSRSGAGFGALFGWVFALSFHMFNGIRHLFWDYGIGLTITVSKWSGVSVCIASIITSIIFGIILLELIL